MIRERKGDSMNAHELVNRIEHAGNAARIDAAREALAEIFNDGVNRGKVEHNDKQIADLDLAVALRDREIARLNGTLRAQQLISKQNFDLATTNQETIKELEIKINQQNAEITELRAIRKANYTKLQELQKSIEAERKIWQMEQATLHIRIKELSEQAQKYWEDPPAIRISKLEQENARLRKNFETLAKAATIAEQDNILIGEIMQYKPKSE